MYNLLLYIWIYVQSHENFSFKWVNDLKDRIKLIVVFNLILVNPFNNINRYYYKTLEWKK